MQGGGGKDAVEGGEAEKVCDGAVRTRTHAPLECGAREESLHDNTMADLRPCMSRADCETFPRCENVIRRDLVEVRLCNHLMADPRQDEPVMNIQRGLFCKSAEIPTGTWVASFGPVVANDRSMRSELGYAVQVRRGNPQREGSWSRKVECVTPLLGWQDKYDGPYVNHTCCTFHVNAEFIATEDYGDEEAAPMTTVNIKTIRQIRNQWRDHYEEILVHYGRDYKQIVGGECKCCACKQRTSKCQAISYSS